MFAEIDAETLHTIIQTGWTMFAAALVLFMQAGFCCLEAGSVRHKNSINVALKNIVDLCGSIAAYFILGYALMFGVTKSGWVGAPEFLLLDEQTDVAAFFFQATFCGTAATIVSGGIAERCRFLPYVIVSVIVGLFIYPIYGHWVWGGGWLSDFAFHDFAGSSVVHMLGAGVALAGIQILGARQGRFTADGKARTLPASSMPLVAIGVIILTFGWIGFNGGSAALGADTATIIANTILAACFGGVAALLVTWAYTGLARAELVLNGVLGGLVAITACADCVSLQASTVIGVAGGIAVVLGTNLLERLKLDDAVGAVPVHGVAGIAGILLTAVFATPEALSSWNEARVAAGKDEISRLGFVGVQAMGAVVCCLWAYLCGLIVWWAVSRIIKLRIGRFEETVGMNYSEHQVSSPAEELAAAVNLAAAGRTDEVQGRLDTAEGDLANLAEAVRGLIDRTQGQVRLVRQFANGIGDVNRTLTDKRSLGRERLQEALAGADGLDERIGNLRNFLADEEQLSRAGSPAILRDLVDAVHERLRGLRELLPQGLQAWEDVGQATGSLDRFLRQLGAAK